MFRVLQDTQAQGVTVTAEVCTGTYWECFAWLLQHQGNSVHYATTWGGYEFQEWNGTTWEVIK
mgnify:FL=1